MTFLDSLLQPILVVNVDGVAAEAATLTSQGPALAASGAAVHGTWQGLSGVYIAPEAPTLFAATLPIQTDMAALGPEVATVAAALTAFATEVRALQAEARALIAEAAALEAQATNPGVTAAPGNAVGTDPLAALRDQLMARAAELLARFHQAEITCANQIRSLAGGAPLVMNNGDGVLADNEYGLTADQWVEAWGGPTVYGAVGAGVVTAAQGDLEAAKGLVTLDGNTWLGLWQVVASLGVVASGPIGMSISNNMDLPGLPKGAAVPTLINVGKGMLAWDEWGRNPANAFGQVLYNFGTLPLAAGKFASGARMGVAATRLGGAALHGLEAAAAATRVRIGDLVRATGTKLDDLKVPVPNRSPALALPGGGRIGGLPDGTFGSRRLGDTGPGQRIVDGTMRVANAIDPSSSRDGHSTPSDVTPEHPEANHTQDPNGPNTESSGPTEPHTNNPGTLPSTGSAAGRVLSDAEWVKDVSANAKVPESFGTPKPNKKGVGIRWSDPTNPGSGVRIDRGDPNLPSVSQQVDHVVVRKDGKVIGRNGEPITGSIKDNAVEAHIPLSEWMTWSEWWRK